MNFRFTILKCNCNTVIKYHCFFSTLAACTKIEFTSSQLGNLVLIYDGYHHIKEKTQNGKVFWICRHRGKKKTTAEWVLLLNVSKQKGFEETAKYSGSGKIEAYLLDVYSIPSTLICWLHKFWRQKTLHFIFFVSKNYFKFKFNIPKLLNSLNFFYIFIFPQDNKMPSTHHSGSKTQSVHSTKRPQPWNFNWISENSVKKIWKSRSSQSEWMKLVIN